MLTRGIISLSIFILALTIPLAAQEHGTSPLLGGTTIDPYNTNLAYIEFGDGSRCSGLLVGSSTVLTAAHCLESEIPNEAYVVGLYGQLRSVRQRYIHPFYIRSVPFSLFNNRHDLGVLELSNSVTEALPTPILLDDPVRSGELAVVGGFGANETTDLLAKAAPVRIATLPPGMFETLLNLSNAGTCSGDSGGPLVQQFGKISAAIGVVSGGSTQVLAGICIATGNDSSFYVDLQSTSSQSFLLQFSDIQFVSGRLIEFKTKADKAIKTCGSVIRAKDFPTLVKNFNALAKAVNQLNRLADGRRRAVLKKIISTLNSAATVRTKREFTRELNNVQNLLRKLSGMGVY